MRTPVPRGFTLIEAMVAMAVLGIALVGTASGFIAAAHSLREGQLRQYKAVLLDASVQRLMLMDKSKLFQTSQFTGATALLPYPPNPPPDAIAIGSAPWVLDWTPASTTQPLDVSTGPFFAILPDGRFSPVTSTALNCADPALPVGTYCRELAVTKGLSSDSLYNQVNNVNTIPGGATAYTVWVRVSRKGEPSGLAAVNRVVFVQ